MPFTEYWYMYLIAALMRRTIHSSALKSNHNLDNAERVSLKAVTIIFRGRLSVYILAVEHTVSGMSFT